MKLIVGLGNPGEKYSKNRHNVGHLVVDRLQTIPHSKDLAIKKTDTFMNESGKFVKDLTIRYSLLPNDLYVVHDDLDIRLGSYKIQFAVGPKVHNGITSIEESLGTKDFWRVRIGVDNREPSVRTPGEGYVLEDFTSQEWETLDKVIKDVCKKLATL